MSDVIIRDKAEYHTRTTDEMERHLSLPPWSLRQKMALACRILAAEGHESALAGQITTRGDRSGTYWMLSFGLGFDEACASNIVLVDDDLRLIEGNGMVNPSNRFHLWIYRHRLNVRNCAYSPALLLSPVDCRQAVSGRSHGHGDVLRRLRLPS